MADWPDTEELAKVVDVSNVADWQTTLDRVLASAIYNVKQDVGDWDEYVDVPDKALAQAALRMAELIASRPGIPVARLSGDATYRACLKGHRRQFPVA